MYLTTYPNVVFSVLTHFKPRRKGRRLEMGKKGPLLCIVLIIVIFSSSSTLVFLVLNNPSEEDLVEKYKDLKIIDVHNHDASGRAYIESINGIWAKYDIDQIVLFGEFSCPLAIDSDAIAWEAYESHPERFYPFFSGFDLHSETCLTIVKENLEKGYFGLGEVIAASTYSPFNKDKPWKGEHPMDGYFPEIYELCAQYQAPILLHIDPPYGLPITKLVEAVETYPNTTFIFGHANAYTSPAYLAVLLENHSNLFIDFFAGFTAYNPNSGYKLADFVPIIEKYPDQFLISSDSGSEITYDEAYKAIYELIDQLPHEIAEKVAAINFEHLMAKRIEIQFRDQESHQIKLECVGERPSKRIDITLTSISLGQLAMFVQIVGLLGLRSDELPVRAPFPPDFKKLLEFPLVWATSSFGLCGLKPSR
jgi:predicted TIM-barrel fold metal-dependent hydrolase